VNPKQILRGVTEKPLTFAVASSRVTLGTLSIASRSVSRALAQAAGDVPPSTDTTGLNRTERTRNEAAANQFFTSLITEFIDRLLGVVDLTDIVVANLDVNRVIEQADIEAAVRRVDLNAAASRIDAEALVNGIDLVAIARYLMEELDVPEIIRESTSAMADDSIEQLRIRGMRADNFVAHLIDRVVRRGADRQIGGPDGQSRRSLTEPGRSR
jgi:hypothetical protein